MSTQRSELTSGFFANPDASYQQYLELGYHIEENGRREILILSDLRLLSDSAFKSRKRGLLEHRRR